ncbi:MAG TPA: D-alanine--D-alanine ligase family protein [Acidimicrobiia bacterium]|nr:D-alanine--D-alanine ligase family protein [Acidimicrobiia bacterium]
MDDSKNLGRLRVAVIYGGQSAEREVSAVSARAVLQNLDAEKYEVLPIIIEEDGEWVFAEETYKQLEVSRFELPKTLSLKGSDIVDRSGAIQVGGNPVDLVIPMLHGPYGEDGTIQGFLEMANIPYVGTSVLGSALCMNKIAAKNMLTSQLIPTVPFIYTRENELVGFVDKVETIISYPCFVKPANMGSSVGITKAHDRDELADAIETALMYDEWILVEKAVVAREIEMSVMGDQEIQVSVPGEIVPGEEFYSYSDKYVTDSAELRIPAPLAEREMAAAQELAIRAYKALCCDGMARVDLFYEKDTGAWMVNELNTIPGFTPISMFPKLFEYSGKNYTQLLDELINIAMSRQARRESKKTLSH